MSCPKCGKEVADHVLFCTFCGNKMPEKAAPAQAEFQPPMNQPPVNEAPTGEGGSFAPPPPPQDFAPQPPRFYGPAGLIRNMLLSPLYLTAIIAFSTYVLFSLFGSDSASAMTSELINELLYKLDLPTEIEGIYSATSSSSAVGSLIGLAPSILVVIGGWMLFASAKKSENQRLNPAGMNLIRISTVITFVLACVSAGLVLIVFLLLGGIIGLGFSYGGSYGYESVFDAFMYDEAVAFGTVLIGLIFVVAIAAIVFLLIYQYKAMATAKTLNTAIKENVVRGKISGFVTVMCYISGVTSGLSALASIFNFATFLATAGSAVSFFCFGMLLSRYKKAVYR